jgi:hypothetical protein
MNKIVLYLIIAYYLNLSSCFSQCEITSKEIYDHIEFLASDSLKGRLPGTTEDKISANYILEDLKKSGLTPIGENGFQYFSINSGCTLGVGNYLKTGNFNAKLMEDYVPLSYSANSELNSDIVFVGFGFDVKNDTLLWNDYSGIDVTGKWVVILRNLPDISLPRELFALYANERLKATTAQNKGASGVILVSGYKSYNNDELTELKLSRFRGNLDIPVIHASRQMIEKLFKSTSYTLKEAEEIISETEKPFSFNLNNKIEACVNIEFQKVITQNIIVFIEGTDDSLKNEYIVIGAHYDHIGLGGEESGSRMKDTIAIHNGADDNASGVASILEIAEGLSSVQYQLKRSVLIIAFGAEEKGMLGSEYFIENPLIELNKISAMINIDMLGKYRKDLGFNIFGVGTSSIFDTIISETLKDTGLKFNTAQSSYGGSDHVSFRKAEIPVLVFNTGIHDDYHTPNDDVELINRESQTEICKLIQSIAIKLINSDNEFDFIDTDN